MIGTLTLKLILGNRGLKLSQITKLTSKLLILKSSFQLKTVLEWSTWWKLLLATTNMFWSLALLVLVNQCMF